MANSEPIAVQQLESLRGLLKDVISGNPFQQEKLAGTGLDESLDSLETFIQTCPFTTKDDLCRDQEAHPPYGRNLTFPVENYTRFCRTSGTTGQSLIWLDREEDWQWMLSSWETVFRATGAKSGDCAFFPFSFGPFLGFWTAFEAAQNLGILSIPGGGMGSLERLQLLLNQRANILCATPTYAIRLAETALTHNIDLEESPIRTIIVAGEPGGSIPQIRKRIENLWPNSKVYDHHGMTEVGPVTFQTKDGEDQLHVIEEAYLAEILCPDTQQPVEDGETGELILSTLGRTGSPLLRYRTGDLVRPKHQGDRLTLEGGILGRLDDMVIIRGVNLHPGAVDSVLQNLSHIAEYQVQINHATTLPEIGIQIEPCKEAPRTIAKQAEEALRKHFLLRIPVEIVAENTLPRFEHKARRWQKIS
ncbi:MAG: AMP-binding protein [Opitutae bacterium]|nr:AMP-binding protein [Opitutae bacterium]